MMAAVPTVFRGPMAEDPVTRLVIRSEIYFLELSSRKRPVPDP
jgi:hypothetical protein